MYIATQITLGQKSSRQGRNSFKILKTCNILCNPTTTEPVDLIQMIQTILPLTHLHRLLPLDLIFKDQKSGRTLAPLTLKLLAMIWLMNTKF